MTPEEPAVLLTEETIRRRVAEMARRISSDYAGVEELLLVGILRGCFIFLADLSRLLTVPRSVDFIAVSCYGKSATPTGAVRIIMDLHADIAGRHVLLVEDIVDSGRTMDYLLRALQARNPASLRVCTLLSKTCRRVVDVPLDYIGFDIPDDFVLGYGLDFGEK